MGGADGALVLLRGFESDRFWRGIPLHPGFLPLLLRHHEALSRGLF